MKRRCLGMMLVMLGLAAGTARGNEQAAALAARTRWLAAQAQANRQRLAIERRIVNSCEYLAAMDDAALARARVEALRRPAIQLVQASDDWRSLTLRRAELERALQALHDAEAPMERIVLAATELSQVRRSMAKLHDEALGRVEDLPAAQAQLREAAAHAGALRQSVSAAVRSSEQWQSARQSASAAQTAWVQAATAAERAAAARWAAQQARFTALIMGR